jgi:hypothetical protein
VALKRAVLSMYAIKMIGIALEVAVCACVRTLKLIGTLQFVLW